MRLALALALALALPACATASGKGDEEWDSRSPTGKTEYWRKGGYASVGALHGFERFKNKPTGVTVSDSDLGFVVRGGWRLDRNVAVEATVESETGYTVNHTPGPNTNIDLWSYGIQGKYYFADQRFQPYGLVGLGTAHATATNGVSDSGGFLRVGAGTEFYLAKDVALFGELSYNRMTGNLKDLDHVDLIVGVLVRF